MSWRLIYSARALRSLKKIPLPAAEKIVDALDALAEEKEPARHVKKLAGSHNPPFYSLRSGEYRAILTIVDEMLIIHVIEAGHRRAVYRDY
jgi:mRNA interferase RelE/StbE